MQIRKPRPRTQACYVEQVDRFARHFRKSPEFLGAAEIRAWQISWPGIGAWRPVHLCSVAHFGLYTVTLRQTWTVKDDIPTCGNRSRLPEVLSPRRSPAFLDAGMTLKQRVILTVCYAAGLRAPRPSG